MTDRSQEFWQTQVSIRDEDIARLKSQDDELRARKCSHGDYRVLGTTGCASLGCEAGRVTMYVIGDGKCTSCNGGHEG